MNQHLVIMTVERGGVSRTEAFFVQARDEQHVVQVIRGDDSPPGRYIVNIMPTPTEPVAADFVLGTTFRQEWQR